jgi:hypothetical protein
MQVIEAQCLWILEPHDHLHISHDSETTSRVAEAIGAQIDLFCTFATDRRLTVVAAPNGGYLRGHTKTQVTVRDE